MSTPQPGEFELGVGPTHTGPPMWGAYAGQQNEVRCRVEQAPMRDGVQLTTEVYLPSRTGRFPVILQRTPYNRLAPNPGSDCDSAIGRYFAERGYATLNQDTRGRYRSEGEFDPMRQEATDGYDAVEWAAAQSWSNGKVGMNRGVVCGADTVAGGDRGTAAPGGHRAALQFLRPMTNQAMLDDLPTDCAGGTQKHSTYTELDRLQATYRRGRWPDPDQLHPDLRLVA